MKRTYPWLRMKATYKANVTGSATFEETIGEALPGNVQMVRVVVEASATLRINPVGAADANSGGLGQNSEIDCWGNKAELDRYEFFTSGTNDISFFVYT